MKLAKMTLPLILILVGVLASGSVLARGGHHRHHGARLHFGVVIGAPLFWPGHYYPAPYYYPPVVAVPASPPVYIEQGSSEAAPPRGNWWYYCADAKAYYPYVKQCPGGWERTAPQPPS